MTGAGCVRRACRRRPRRCSASCASIARALSVIGNAKLPPCGNGKVPTPPPEEGEEMSTEGQLEGRTIGSEVISREEVPMVRRERWEELRRLAVDGGGGDRGTGPAIRT